MICTHPQITLGVLLNKSTYSLDETYRLKTGDSTFFDSIRQGIVFSG